MVGPAVFWHLTDLRLGDTVIVTRSDGVTVRFEVVQIRRVPRASFPTEQVYGATPDSVLRLITCGGLYDHVHGRYLDNVLVVALAV
jgi:sortase (surface protein transpeptidase)